jgi:tRNA threonylcarbamoyladenosine biosynthesis protein TsaB
MLLAIDSSTQTMGVALYDGVVVRGELVWQTRNHHTVELAPAIRLLMSQVGVTAQQLSALGVALGPGSFTSLRIGLALAKGMALALHLPLIGIPTLDVLTAAQPLSDLPLLAILQAGRGRLAAQTYHVINQRWTPQGDLKLSNIEDLGALIRKPTQVCGELSEDERAILARKRKNVLLASPAACLRRPGFLAELAWQRWGDGQVDEPVSLAPIYIHISEALPG